MVTYIFVLGVLGFAFVSSVFWLDLRTVPIV